MALATYPAETEILSAPSLIYHTPTNLSSEANYGTLVGLLDGPVRAQRFFQTRQTTAEPHGRRPLKEWFLGSWWEIEFRVKSWNAASLTLAFPGQNSTTDVKAPGAAAGSGLLIGTDLVASYGKCLVVMPLDECTVNKCMVAQNAVCRAVGPIEHGPENDVTLAIKAICYEKPSNPTNTYREFFIGNKSNATILS